jgi:hypothetical protein
VSIPDGASSGTAGLPSYAVASIPNLDPEFGNGQRI